MEQTAPAGHGSPRRVLVGIAQTMVLASAFTRIDRINKASLPARLTAMACPAPVKFDAAGHRVDAPLIIVQWQNGAPVTVYPVDRALAVAKWPKSA